MRASEAAVELLIDDALAQSKRLRQMRKRILRAQQALRRLVGDDAWAAYLALEEVVNARAEAQLEIVCRRLLAIQSRRVL